jgi:prepilin-type N-terminal cleavage/methylation domain-containing protein
MNHEPQNKKGFTLIELMVAVAILAIVLAFAGMIFKVGIDSHRTAIANAEIMQKLRAITNQLNSDFKGLRKDGEIFVVWVVREAVAANYDGYHDCDNDGYERFDRIMFFADGDFQSYGYGGRPMVRGNLARICYMLAKNRSGKRAEEYTDISLTEQGRKQREKERRQRILARTQHIFTADPDLQDFFNSPTFDWYKWNNWYEYDKMSLEQWKTMDIQYKINALSVIGDVRVYLETMGPTVDESVCGAHVDPADPCTIHILLCEGVGEFKVQGWYDAQRRWVPEVDPNGDGVLSDTDFPLTPDGSGVDPCEVPGVLYPYGNADENHFYEIPGLGRAFKFTFTLYDSKGVIKNGRTFTHIVYLD